MWITPPFAATPTVHNPQAPVDNSESAVDYLYAQPLIHRLSTTNPQGYPQSYPHGPAHRAGLESHPGIDHQTPTPPQTPPTQKWDTCHGPPATDTHDSQKTGTNSEKKHCKQQTENAQASQPQGGAPDTGRTGPRAPPTPAPDGTTPTAQHTPQTSTTSNEEI